MKKFTFALTVAAALIAATVGLSAPASATPSFSTGCSVHTTYQGNPVDVEWC
jgi:hypothetical protein